MNTTTEDSLGNLHEITVAKDSVLIFQLNRDSDDLEPSYIAAARDLLKTILPEGKLAVIVGRDVNVYELAGPDAVALKLAGII